MTLYDKPTSAPHIYAPPRYDDLPDPTMHPQEELAAGFKSLRWFLAAVAFSAATYVAVWVTG